MAESMPGTMSVFASAYQSMLASQGKGGGLTGQAAVAALLEAVPTGSVRSNELLPFVSEEMQKRAAPKLDIARETSQGWQGRLANQRTGWAMIASESGVEEGQRNFFRFFTQWMNENQQIPQKFGEMWKNISEQFVIAGGFGGLLKEVLGGEENIISEWLGPEKTAKFISDFESLSSAAETAARFLGLMKDPTEKEQSGWQTAVEKLAAGMRIPGAIMDGEFGEANESRKILFEGGGDAYLRRMPHLKAIQGVYNFAASPERDDEGYALAYLKMTGRQATYHPRGAELLMNTTGGNASEGPSVTIENLVVKAPESSDPEVFARNISAALDDVLKRSMQGLNR